MNRTFFKYILSLCCLLLLFSATASAQAVKVEASLQDFTIKIGDQTKLFLIVSQPANQRVNFPKFQDTITTPLQIVSTNKADTVVDQQDKKRITITQSYTITSFEAGIHNIPASAFGTSAGVLKSNGLSIQVQTVKIDTTKAIFDIKKPIIVTYTFMDWLKDNWGWVAAGVLAIALIISIVSYLRNRPKVEPIIKIIKPKVPPHTVALGKLSHLKESKIWQQGEFKQYHTQLADIMREYLEQRYQIKVYEKTTDEIIAALNNKDITAEYRALLEQLLSLADLAKFAKFNPLPHENEASMDNAVTFVLKTKQEERPSAGTNTEGGGVNGTV